MSVGVLFCHISSCEGVKGGSRGGLPQKHLFKNNHKKYSHFIKGFKQRVSVLAQKKLTDFDLIAVNCNLR